MFGQIQKGKTCLLRTKTIHVWLFQVPPTGLVNNEKLRTSQLHRIDIWGNEWLITCIWVLSAGLQWKDGNQCEKTCYGAALSWEVLEANLQSNAWYLTKD